MQKRKQKVCLNLTQKAQIKQIASPSVTIKSISERVGAHYQLVYNHIMAMNLPAKMKESSTLRRTTRNITRSEIFNVHAQHWI